MAKCTVRRLMRHMGIQGVTRGRAFKTTTTSDGTLVRPRDPTRRIRDQPPPTRQSSFGGWTVLLVGASRSSECIQEKAREALAVLLTAHRSSATVWAESGFSRSEEDRLEVARTLLDLSFTTSTALNDHLHSFLASPVALSELLRDFLQVATYDTSARLSMRQAWPEIMDLVLDAVDADQDLWSEGRRRSREPLAKMVPAPQLSIGDGDPDSTLQAAADGWPSATELDARIARWIPLATGIPEAMDGLVSFLRTHPKGSRLRWDSRGSSS